MNNVTRVLVIGQGGREHAIVRQIAQNSSIETVYVVPGSDGIAGTSKSRVRFDELGLIGISGLSRICERKPN